MRHQLDEQERGEGKAGKKADAVNSPYCFSPTLDSFPMSRKGQGWLVAAARMNGSALSLPRAHTARAVVISFNPYNSCVWQEFITLFKKS